MKITGLKILAIGLIVFLVETVFTTPTLSFVWIGAVVVTIGAVLILIDK